MSKPQKIARSQLIMIVMVALVSAVATYGATLVFKHNNQATQPINCHGVCVSLAKTKATPDTLAVKVGGFVQFNNTDDKTHNLSLGGGSEHHAHAGDFSSGDIKAGEAWQVQFKQEGSFVFHDRDNSKVNIVVVVYTPGKDYTIQ